MRSIIRDLMGNKQVLPENYRFFIVLQHVSLVGLTFHALYVLTFLWLDVPKLALFNLVGAIAYVATVVMNHRGHHNVGLLLSSWEIVLNATLCVLTLGWEAGFQLYLPILVLGMFFNATCRTITKVIIAGWLCAVYIGLHTWSIAIAPLIPLDAPSLRALHHLNSIIAFLIFAVIGYYYGMATTHVEQELRSTNAVLEQLAQTDPLTHLLNRRVMTERIEAELTRSRRNGRPFTLVMADVDDFKAFNDRYGHDCGDYVLTALADLIRSAVRREDCVARWGGEEFLIVLPETDLPAGGIVAERIRRRLAAHPLVYNARPLSVTMTFGVAACRGQEDALAAIAQADQALYAGKQTGKDCVVLT